MKRLYPKLAWQSLRHNGKFYFPYFLTILFTAAVFYILLALSRADDLPSRIRYAYLGVFMQIGVFLVGVFAVVFLFYTNSFLMKRRTRELGLYNVLGMGKRNIAAVLVWETLILGLSGVVGGILTGILLQRLLTLIVYRVVRFSTGFTFYISWVGIAVTALFFGAVLLVNLLCNLIRLGRQNAVTMLREGSAGEKEPKAKWLLALIGFLALGSGYYIALRVTSSMEAFANYFLAVFLVILGTYCLFTAGSITILKLLKKNKRYYYKTGPFITLSGMLYRMKRNGVGLANICILCTMTLVMISGTVSLYLGTEGVVDMRTPADWTSTLDFRPADGEAPDFDGLTERMEAVAEAQGVPAKDSFGFLSMTQDLMLRDGALNTCPEDEAGVITWEADFDCLFLTADAYGVLTGKPVSLEADEVLVWCQGRQLPETLNLVYDGWDQFQEDGEARSFQVREFLPEFPATGGWSPLIGAANATVDGICVVLPDQETFWDLYQQYVTATGRTIVNWTLFTTLSGTDAEKLEAYSNAFEDYDGEGYPDFTGTGSWTWFRTESRAMNLAESYSMNGGFFFLGVFLGVLFLMAAVLIIYYKQISEGYEDRQRFQIMQKVGLERRQIKRSINRQILVVFFLPLLAAALHLLFNFRLMVLLLQLFAMTDVRLTATCSLLTFGVFAVLYILVYRITARSYYKIVS